MHPVFLILSAGRAYVLAWDMVYKTRADEFWRCMAAVHGLAWVFLIMASVIAPRSWQDRPAGAQMVRWRERWRLWSYGSPTLPPSGLVVEQDAEIAELIHEIVVEGKGKIAQRQPELWSARFDDSPHALSTAKTLQQRFLTFHRKTEPQQVVPSILIYPTNGDKPSGPDGALPEDMLANVTSAQILIAECIYEVMKNAPGFRFNSTPLRKAGETFGPEGIYEMLWTDESTYGHLRKASRAGLKTVGRYQIQEELGRTHRCSKNHPH